MHYAYSVGELNVKQFKPQIDSIPCGGSQNVTRAADTAKTKLDVARSARAKLGQDAVLRIRQRVRSKQAPANREDGGGGHAPCPAEVDAVVAAEPSGAEVDAVAAEGQAEHGKQESAAGRVGITEYKCPMCSSINGVAARWSRYNIVPVRPVGSCQECQVGRHDGMTHL